MHYHVNDTIVAIASAAGGAARHHSAERTASCRNCLVRVPLVDRFGTAAGSVGRPSGRSSPVRSRIRRLRVPAKFAGRALFLADGAELYSPTFGRVPYAGFAAAIACGGARNRYAARGPARPGEFTLRAFLAGRIDLTQAEAVLGVIDALDQPSLQTALTQLAGGLARPLAGLRDRLLDLLARLEAGLDFVEEDIEFIEAAEILSELEPARSAVASLQAQLARRRLDRPPSVVLVGPPNAGKSSLFNALIGGQALVSDEPGTTRDYLRGHLNLNGVCCELIDTAGVLLPAASDPVAHDAQSQSADQARQADVRLYCQDATSTEGADVPETRQAQSSAALWVITKIDRLDGQDLEKLQLSAAQSRGTRQF